MQQFLRLQTPIESYGGIQPANKRKRSKGGSGVFSGDTPPLASFYVDDLRISCEDSDTSMIERQLQTAVNNIVKWCNTNGHSISASKSCCVHFCRKRGIHPDPEIRISDVQIPVVPNVLSNTSWGADRASLLRVYQAIVLSRIDYGCVVYGSACNSTLKKLDPVHHMALKICSGAFRTSPMQESLR
ncbi:putative RNA-directed DNA polymerase from transposon BS [Trichonephila clavipes]|nr:putative RNA-directed DNA polymerase from transposon BS [Trichonephila clavipes]